MIVFLILIISEDKNKRLKQEMYALKIFIGDRKLEHDSL